MNRILGIGAFVISVVLGGIFCSSNGALYNALFVPPKAPEPVYTTDNEPVGGPAYPVPATKVIRYWIHNCPVTKDTVVEVDKVLEDLNAAHIAQTIFLCMPKSDISQPVPYAERFLRYMGLGMASGQRKNNGVVFLISYDDKSREVRVNYAVGFGLPALTAPDFGNTAREALGGSSFNVTTKYDDLDITIKALAQAYDKNVRAKYQPFEPTEPHYGSDPAVEENKGQYNWIIYLVWLYYFLLGSMVGSVLSFIAILSGRRVWLISWLRFFFWPLELMANYRGGTSPSFSTQSTSSHRDNGGHTGDGGGKTGRGG